MICLMPNCAFLSETSRMVQILRALEDRGAEARIATHGGPCEAVLRGEGIEYDVVEPHVDAARGRRFLSDLPGIGDPGQSMYGHDEMRAHVLAEAEYFRRNATRAVVTGFTLTALFSTRLAGIPLVTDHAGSYLPPLLDRLGIPTPPPSQRPYLGGFDAVADGLGLPRIPSFAALLLGDLALVTEAPEVYGTDDAALAAWRPTPGAFWPTTRLEATGPIFAELDCPLPPAIASALRRDPPTAYVAITSAPEDLVRRAVREVAASGMQVVVASPAHDLSDLAGPRVAVGGLLPSHRIMPQVTLAVTAGGQGSLQCAMAAGTPVIGIPLQPEQEANLTWLERAGAAKRLPAAEVGRGALPGLVRRMISDPSHKVAATALSALYARRNGPALSADAILRFLARRE
jgi:UDP:flavonoid glycosyltransferase YjiC (YdhE family)